MPTYKAGDLIWVHIGGGYGWWPCQVMEPHHTPEQKRAEVLRIKRPGCVLVHCFGDDTFNWYDPRDIADLANNFNVRAAQRHKSPAVKKHFKLALEQAQEVADVRAGRPPSTQHKPVDFTQPETYEHLIAAPAAAAVEGDISPEDARLAMRYPAAAAAEDCQAGGAAAAAAVRWLLEAARDPALVCKELSEAAAATATSAGAAPAYMRLLWSLIHESAVEQHGPDRFSSRRKSSKKTADAAAAAAGSSKGQLGDGGNAERTSITKHKGLKRRISDAAAAARGDRHQQPKKHKQQQQQGVEVDQTDPRQYDQYILAYGGPIPGAKIPKAVQLLAQAAVNPISIVSPLTSKGAKSIAILMRWREAAFEESRSKMEGELGKMVKSALLRAGAYPILAPKEPPGSDQQQQQGLEGSAAAAAAAGESLADVGNGVADSADFRVQSDRGDSDTSRSSSDDEIDLQQQQHSDRARKPPRQSSRAVAATEGEQSALAAIKAVQGASRHDRIRWRQQQLAAAAALGPDLDESDQSHEIGRDDDSSSDWDVGSSKRRKKQRAGSASGSSATAAAAAAAKDEESNVTVIDVKQYADRIPANSTAFLSDMQRWGAERAKEQSLGKIAGHDLTQADAYNIFKLVADRGGHDAACQRRAWGAITREWYPDLMTSGKNVSAALRKWYMRHLLGYERHLSVGCPVVTKSFNLTASGGAKISTGSGGARPRQRATPRKEATAAKKIKREPGIDDAATATATAAAAVNGGDGSSSSSDSEGSNAEDQGLQVDIKPTTSKSMKPDPGAARTTTKAAAATADRPRRRLPLPPPAAAAAPSPGSSTKPPAAAAAAPNTSDFNEADRRLVKFTFRNDYKLPPMLTVLNAARKYQHDMDKANIRVYKHQPIASILYSSATIAGLAAEGFRKYGRKMLRVPEDEPFDVEVTWLPERRVDGGRDSSAQANSTNKAHGDSIAAAAAGSSAQLSDDDRCLLKLTFRKGYNLPSAATVQQAARRFHRHMDRANVRVYKREPIASILFPDADTAAAAADQFRQHGKQWMKMPDEEPLKVEVTWLIGKSGEVVRPKPPGTTAYYARSAPPQQLPQQQQQQQPLQQQQQRLFTAMPPPGGPRPMLNLAPGLAPLQQQQQISLPGGIVILPGTPVGAPGAAAAAARAPILTLPGLGPGMPQQAPLLLDPRRQQQQPVLGQYQPGRGQQQQQPGLVVSGPPPLMQQQQQRPPQQQQPMLAVSGPPPQHQQQVLPPRVDQQQQQLQMPLQHAGAPWQQQQQQQQAPAPPTMLPIIDLAALANAIGASTHQQQQQQQQQQAQQQQQPLLMPIQPLQHGFHPAGGGPPQQQQQQPQLSIHQLQLPQLQPLPQQHQQQQQQQQMNSFAWNQAEFQAKLQDLLKGLPPSNGS